MTFSQKRQKSRYTKLRERQPTTGWVADYQAGQRATREESPSISRPSILSQFNRFGRELHAHSIPERSAILLALFNPKVFDLREQYVLNPTPSPHPFAGHARFVGVAVTELPGALQVYEALSALDCYPVIRERNKAGDLVERPDLLVSDLVLGVEDEQGPFGLHWSVKKDRTGFEKPPTTDQLLRDPQKKLETYQIRLAAEKLYFGAAGISTKQFWSDRLDSVFISNLLDAFCWRSRAISKALRLPEVEGFLVGVDLELESPFNLSLYVNARWGASQEDFKMVLYSLVWERRIRPDLFRRLLFNVSWRHESVDPLKLYADVFER